MILGELLGQETALTILERAILSGRLPHAMLFHGPAGTGKRTAALRLAATLQCTAREERSEYFIYHRADPYFDAVRNDPLFRLDPGLAEAESSVKRM